MTAWFDVEKRLEAEIADEAERALALSILGTGDVAQVEDCLRVFTASELRADIERLEFFELSVAAVFGLRLADERRIVIKVFRQGTDPAFVESLTTVQNALADQGFPCPPALRATRRFGKSEAIVMPLLDNGIYTDATEPTVRREWASLLCSQVELSRSFIALPGFTRWRPPEGRLWQVPHNVLFDFDGRSRGAEWIDRIAADALAVLAEQDYAAVLGHADWSAKHFRYDAERPRGERITVVYDWDSLRLGTELEIVATAAMTYSVTWYLAGLDVLPEVEDSLAFVSDYEGARRSPFSDDERRTLEAAARYACAYTARCEHALDPHERNVTERSARTKLRDAVRHFRL